MPLTAVAVRYSAIRGASFEPGGCSATPTSAWAAASARRPAVVPPAAGVKAAAEVPATGEASAPVARLWAASVDAKLDGAAVAGGLGAAEGATRARSSSAMRAITSSTLITTVLGRHGAVTHGPRQVPDE